MNWRVPTFFAAFSFKTRRTHTSISLHGKSRLTDSAIIAFDFITGTLNKKVFLVDSVVIMEKIRAQIKLVTRKWSSLRKHLFLLALRGWRRFARRNASATQRQKFHTDDANQCLLNKFVSHGVPSVNLFNFRFLLVDFGKMLCSTANEPQQNSNHCPRQDYIPQILTVLLEIHRVYIWPVVFCLFKSRLSLIVRVNIFLNRTVVDSDWSTTCAVVIFRVKVSCITSVDGIILWLSIAIAT